MGLFNNLESWNNFVSVRLIAQRESKRHERYIGSRTILTQFTDW